MGLSGRVPLRVDGATKAGLLGLLDDAVQAGWTPRRACHELELGEVRAHRWMARRAAGELAEQAPGGAPRHGLLNEEVAEILALFDEWGETDRSHRKLAHRGSYLGRVWVSPSSVRRVPFLGGQALRAPAQTRKVAAAAVPGLGRTQAQLDLDPRHDALPARGDGGADHRGPGFAQVDHRGRLGRGDLHPGRDRVHRRPRNRGPVGGVERRQDGLVDLDVDDESRPILLAVSDNGPQMTSGSTREFLALCAIAQHFGRPGTPTDQAWVESFNGHLKAQYPHLLAIEDPATLRAELAVVREHWTGVRLHAGIGYVTPNDEHEGRGEAIRKARQAGLQAARNRRLAWHRQNRHTQPQDPDDVD